MALKTGKIREKNCQNILCAAEIEFVKHGFKGASMQAIADLAGLPKANVLYYFNTKQDLYCEVLANISARWDSPLDDISDHDEPAKVLTRYICNKVDLAIRYPNASKIYAAEIIHGAPNLQDQLRTSVRSWFREKTKIIDSWIALGKMDAVDPQLLIFMIWSTTQHYADFETQILTVSNKQEYETEDIEAIKRFLCQVILKGIGLEPVYEKPLRAEEQFSCSL